MGQDHIKITGNCRLQSPSLTWRPELQSQSLEVGACESFDEWLVPRAGVACLGAGNLTADVVVTMALVRQLTQMPDIGQQSAFLSALHNHSLLVSMRFLTKAGLV